MRFKFKASEANADPATNNEDYKIIKKSNVSCHDKGWLTV